MRLLRLLVLSLFFLPVACAPGPDLSSEGPILESRAHLVLVPSGSEPGRVDVVLTGYPAEEKPRVMELFVSYAPELEFSGGVGGEAAAGSGKEVVIQAPSSGLIRVVVYGAGSAAPIGQGTLASLRFTGSGEGVVGLRSDAPVFAPTAANSGLLLGESVRVFNESL